MLPTTPAPDLQLGRNRALRHLARHARHRFVANRTYDALACGALVVSDDVAGLNGSVGKGVATYAQPHELGKLIERLLADPAQRARGAAGVRAVRPTTPAAVALPVLVKSRQHLT